MSITLPGDVRALLHDCDPSTVSWDAHRAFLIDRILSDGPWSSICWLRRTLGDRDLAAHIVDTRGRRLSPRQLRFWQVILDLPEADVTTWLADPARAIWDGRNR